MGGANAHIILDDAFHYLQEHGLSGFHHCDTPTGQANGAVTNGTATNGHVVNGASANRATDERSITRLLIWSAADAGATDRMLQAYQSYYQANIIDNHRKLNQLAYTLAARRSVMPWRTFAVVDGVDGNGGPAQLTPTVPVRASSEKVSIGFIFTGQGAQYAGMGLELLQYPIFESSLRASGQIFASLGAEWSIRGELKSRCLSSSSPQSSDFRSRGPYLCRKCTQVLGIRLLTCISRCTAPRERHSPSPVQPAIMHSAADRSGRPPSQLRRLSSRGSWAFKWRDRRCLYHRRPVPEIGLQGGLFQRLPGWEAGCHHCHFRRHDVGQLGRARGSKSPREAWPGERGQCGSRCLRQQPDERHSVRSCRFHQGLSKLPGPTRHLCEDCAHRRGISLTGT